MPKVWWVTWHSGWPLTAWQDCLPNEISRVMPTLCLFLLPLSPAHLGALYLANSRPGCASIFRSRAGHGSQAQRPALFHLPFRIYLNFPVWICVTIVFPFSHCYCPNPPLYCCFSALSQSFYPSMKFYSTLSICTQVRSLFVHLAELYSNLTYAAKQLHRNPRNHSFSCVCVTGLNDCS